MSSCQTHNEHNHTHGSGCGHKTIRHDDHTDYMHDSHLHHVHGEHVDEHSLCVCSTHPSDCTPDHSCDSHESGHKHGAGCGHDSLPHGDHTCYVVGSHLHSPHAGHCDDHGKI